MILRMREAGNRKPPCCPSDEKLLCSVLGESQRDSCLLCLLWTEYVGQGFVVAVVAMFVVVVDVVVVVVDVVDVSSSLKGDFLSRRRHSWRPIPVVQQAMELAVLSHKKRMTLFLTTPSDSVVAAAESIHRKKTQGPSYSGIVTGPLNSIPRSTNLRHTSASSSSSVGGEPIYLHDFSASETIIQENGDGRPS